MLVCWQCKIFCAAREGPLQHVSMTMQQSVASLRVSLGRRQPGGWGLPAVLGGQRRLSSPTLSVPAQ